MTDDKGRPDDGGHGNGDGNGNGNGHADGGAGESAGYGENRYGQDQNGQGEYGQQSYDQGQYGQNQYGQGQYGQQPYDQNQYGQGQYGQQPYDQGQYGQQSYGQDQYGQHPYGQGRYGQQPYDQNQYAGYAGQGQGQWGAGQGQGQWGQQAYGEPGAGVDQPGGELPPTSPVMSGAAQFNITQPLSTAFKRVNANIGPWLGYSAAVFGVLIIVMLVFFGIIFGGMASSLSSYDPADPMGTSPGGLMASMGALILMYPVLFAVMFVMMVFGYRGAFEEIDGRTPGFGTFFRVGRWGSLLGAWLLSGVIAFAAMIPGYLVMFLGVGMSSQSEGAGVAIVLLAYALIIAGAVFVTPITSLMPMLVMDGRAKVLESPGTAWVLVKGRFWPVLGALLLAGLVGAVGVMLCYIGALYTMPIQMVAYVELYRQLVGGRRPVPMA